MSAERCDHARHAREVAYDRAREVEAGHEQGLVRQRDPGDPQSEAAVRQPMIRAEKAQHAPEAHQVRRHRQLRLKEAKPGLGEQEVRSVTTALP